MYKYRYEKDGSATNCFPEDTDTVLWVRSHDLSSIRDLMEKAKEKWPDVDFSDVSIDVEHHHQYCIYYDLHDSSDYVDYIVLSIE